MLLLQILTLIVFFGLILIAVLAFIEPGPLNRRSRDKRGKGPEEEIEEEPRRRPPDWTFFKPPRLDLSSEKGPIFNTVSLLSRLDLSPKKGPIDSHPQPAAQPPHRGLAALFVWPHVTIDSVL